MFRAFRTAPYEESFGKLSAAEQMRVQKLELEIASQPYAGKPLGYKFFREKRFGGKRMLFLIYHEQQKVLFVSLSDKKSQEQDIQSALHNLDTYKENISKFP